jgi:hypothetical protein
VKVIDHVIRRQSVFGLSIRKEFTSAFFCQAICPSHKSIAAIK